MAADMGDSSSGRHHRLVSAAHKQVRLGHQENVILNFEEFDFHIDTFIYFHFEDNYFTTLSLLGIML